MKLYVARHGETQWNRELKICGATNLPLTEKGKEQAKELAEKVAGYDIDIIIASPMKRAVATAQAVSERCGIPCILDPRLFEMNFGTFEGTDRQNPDFDFMLKNAGVRCEGGESIFQLVHRIYSFLDEVKIRYQGKKVLLVCHGTVSRAIHSYFESLNNEEFYRYRLDNCQLQEYDL